MDDELDSSWIQTEEKIDTIENKYFREPCEAIDIFFIYLDKDDSIEKIICEKEIPTDDKIDKDRLLKIIQTKRFSEANKKYKLFDILSFQIDLEPERIMVFNNNENLEEIANTYFKVLPIFDSIECIPSIFIFHDINSIYFLFKEDDDFKIKSIMKSDNNKRATKKVRIMENIGEDIEKSSQVNPKNKSIKYIIKNKGNKNKTKKLIPI